jgi:hypothetical protein
VRALQQRWQAQAHQVPIDRRQEQKLWDAFRKPIDDAFQRKTLEREKAEASLGQRDRVVMDASKALQAANASGDAGQIRAAMAALDAALHGQAQAQAQVTAAGAQEAQVQAVADSVATAGAASVEAASAEASPVEAAQSDAPASDAAASDEGAAPAPAVAPAPKPAPKPVVAMRGDDRPGMKREAPAADAARAGKWNERKDAGRGGRDRDPRGGDRDVRGARDSRGERADPRQTAPRLGDAAFRAQREALESAQFALRKLAAQAHGEALTQLLSAWEHRDGAQIPTAQVLGQQINAATRSLWTNALGGNAPKASTPPAQALLRLEMAAEIPTPADHLDERRALQLQLLTRRNDPSPAQTWGQDVAVVLASPFAAADARRLQNSLKALLKR